MKVAVGQFASGQDVGANTAMCVSLISDAGSASADLVILPEMSMYFDPRHNGSPPPHGQPLGGPFATAMAQAAKEAGIAVLVGMLESSGGGDQRDYNTLIAFGSRGDTLGSYRKIHLYDAFGYRESDEYLPGEITRPLTFDVGGIAIGALTCYDLRFPEAFRYVMGDADGADEPVDLVALPAAWMAGPRKEHHWQALLAARAIENTVYVAASGQTGRDCCGLSAIVDPMGTVIAGVGQQPGIAVAEIDTAHLRDVRETNPSLANRRFATVRATRP